MNFDLTQQSVKCENCKKDFPVFAEDLVFYNKIDVSIPKICPECRAQLRLSFRNERVFYKRPCDNCKKDVVSMYSKDKPYTVWCYDCWFSDDWDALDYGLEYKPEIPFLKQVQILLEKVPKVALIYMRSPGSQYLNISADNKNCYMIIESSNNEDCINCYWIQLSNNILDSSFTNKVEYSYEVDDCYDCHGLKWAKGCHSCMDSYFLLDCRGCTNCFGCVNLRSQQYCIFNAQYTKEEYEKFISEARLDTYSGIEKAKIKFEEFILKNPRKYAEVVQAINSTGNYIKNAKNCFSCFHTYDSEDCRYGVHTWRDAKDCVDVDTAGRGASLIYNSINSGLETSNQIACNLCWSSTFAFYSTYSLNCNNILGCVGLRKKDYCILNKKYDKETYESIFNQIKKSMKEDSSWGNFFEKSFSSFGYNESAAYEQFPLSKEDALLQGFKWEDLERGIYKKETVDWANFPDSIKDLSEDFDLSKEVFACIKCNKNYRIIQNELMFYRKMQIPIPRECPQCRHDNRFKKRGPNKLWTRTCMCQSQDHKNHNEKCAEVFKTNFSPDRPEIIYCEQCYNLEVY